MDYNEAKHRYPLDRWETDFRFLLEEVAKLPPEERTPAFEAYYEGRYPDDPHSSDNRLRMICCVNYFMNHLAEFSLENFANWGRTESRISPHLVVALYRLFASVGMGRLGDDFPVAK